MSDYLVISGITVGLFIILYFVVTFYLFILQYFTRADCFYLVLSFCHNSPTVAGAKLFHCNGFAVITSVASNITRGSAGTTPSRIVDEAMVLGSDCNRLLDRFLFCRQSIVTVQHNSPFLSAKPPVVPHFHGGVYLYQVTFLTINYCNLST